MERAYRIDRGGLGRARRTDDGRLIADAYVTRSGVFAYRQPDGSIMREWRPPEEVFRPDSLETLEAVVVTHEHPPEMISPDSSMSLSVRKSRPHFSAGSSRSRSSRKSTP